MRPDQEASLIVEKCYDKKNNQLIFCNPSVTEVWSIPIYRPLSSPKYSNKLNAQNYGNSH